MRNSRALRWLQSELPVLVTNNVLTKDAAAALRAHYNLDDESAESHRIGIILCAILGAALIGAGLILLLAHNWDELSRPVRTIISVLPLVIAQALSAFALARRPESRAWAESTATLNMLTIGSSIALVGQTYNIPGNFSDFLFAWMLLGLPLIYLLGSAMVSIAYLGGITVWMGGVTNYNGEALWFWPLLLAVLPFFVVLEKGRRTGIRGYWFSTAIAICVPIGLGFTTWNSEGHLWIIAFSSCFAAMYLAGVLWFDSPDSSGLHPFRALGALGVAGLSLILSFGDPWRSGSWHSGRWPATASQIAFGIEMAFPLLAVILFVLCLQKRKDFDPLIAALPAVAALGFFIARHFESQIGPSVLINVYALALGLTIFIRGVKRDHLPTANLGMLVIAALVIARFFDSDLGFVVRGVAFILAGIGFMAGNFILLKKRRTT